MLEYVFLCAFPIAEATPYDSEMKGDARLKSSSSRMGEFGVCWCRLLQNNGLKYTTT